MKTYAIIITIVALALFGYIFMAGEQATSPNLGYQTSTISNTSSSIGVADVLVVNVGANLRYLRVTDLGPGRAYCRFDATSTLSAVGTNYDSGILLNPKGSSTLTSFETMDANMLAKSFHCFSPDAAASTTLGVLKY